MRKRLSAKNYRRAADNLFTASAYAAAAYEPKGAAIYSATTN